MKAGVIAGALVLVLAAEQAAAHSTRKQCQRACGGLITACATRNEDLGDFRRACKAVVLKRCKREGDDVCGATTTSTIPTETSTTTTSTSTTTTTLRFVDNGDGTVTDRSTGLMWEQKENLDFVPNGNDLRDADNTHDWATAMGEWLSDLNGWSDVVSPKTPGFAGYSDWRLPNVDELQTILLAPAPCGTSPCIDPIFGPTVAALYWSSTTDAGAPAHALTVSFGSGFPDNADKNGTLPVRAVRGGL